MGERAALIIGHGSRRKSSNEALAAMAIAIEPELKARYSMVRAGFLEVVQPDIFNSIQGCVLAGADHIVLLPFFLSPGKHVAVDVPREVQKAQIVHPHITLELKPYFGSSACISELVCALLMQP